MRARRRLAAIDDGNMSSSITRNRYSIGGGADLGATRLFDSIYFRVHRAHPTTMVDRFGDPVIYETSLVFGMNLVFGH